MKNKILLIEDDAEIRDMIKDYLSGDFEISSFSDGTTAVRNIKSYDDYSLALIDLMLPDMRGMEIIRTIRQVSTVPIIIITAKDNDTDKSLGLNLGADDYVVKPFSLIELTARIRANIRRARTYQAVPGDTCVRIRDLEIDPAAHTVSRQGAPIELTPIEFKILHLLATHPGQAFSKERLYELIWKEPYFGNENVLNTHINRLRLKLKNGEEDTTAYTRWRINKCGFCLPRFQPLCCSPSFGREYSMRNCKKRSAISAAGWKRFLPLLKTVLFFSLPTMPVSKN